VSSEATNWVRDRWSGPPKLLPLMFLVASYCDASGCGFRAGPLTVAEKLRLGPWNTTIAPDDVEKAKKNAMDNAKRLLREAEKGGHLSLGDQSLVAHLTKDRRPKVYDIAGFPRTAKNSERGGLQTPPRGGLQTAHGGVCRPPKTLPFGKETAPTSAQGSAQRSASQDHDFAERADTPGICRVCEFPLAKHRRNLKAV